MPGRESTLPQADQQLGAARVEQQHIYGQRVPGAHAGP